MCYLATADDFMTNVVLLLLDLHLNNFLSLLYLAEVHPPSPCATLLPQMIKPVAGRCIVQLKWVPMGGVGGSKCKVGLIPGCQWGNELMG